MVRKLIVVALLGLGLTVAAWAEPMRPLLTKENRFPSAEHLEVGGRFTYVEFNDQNEQFITQDANKTTLGVLPRYGITDTVAVYGGVPYSWISPDSGRSESGVGDVTLGFEALVYQDIFDAPWVIPHFEMSFHTGDEDKGLGAGENRYTFGLAIGAVQWDVVHFIGDVRYQLRPDSENVASLAGALIWDVTEHFSVLGEAKVTDEESKDADSQTFFQGGLAYDVSEQLTIMAYGGGATDSAEDVVITARAVYTF